jgi:4-hydroxymandelate oxidase
MRWPAQEAGVDTRPVIALDELEAAAAAVLEPAALDYFRGGADDERTLDDNIAAWRRLRLRPHVLRDVSVVDGSTTVLGTPVATPVLVAPTAFHRLASSDGESATAVGTAAAGSVMVLSTMSTQPLETVAAAAPDAARWFQLYVHHDREWTAALAKRAADAGYRALVLTVDVPVLGRRRRDERHGFGLPPGVSAAHTLGPIAPAGTADGSGLATYLGAALDAALGFDDLAWLREVSGLPVVVKGVLRGDDARRCVDAGAAAVVVSNHGGRQLDSAVATADALPEVVDAVEGRAEVYVDGGIRTGTDVLKALALGARAVLVGRLAVYGLAVGGADGVADVIRALDDELRRAMALCGAARLSDLTPDLVVGATGGNAG